MDKLIKQMLEKAKKDHKFLRKLKMFATDASMYDLASQLRELELKNFPETNAVKNDKKDAEMLSRMFGMVDLSVNEKTAYIILKCVEGYKKKKGKFSIRESSDIKHNADELFL